MGVVVAGSTSVRPQKLPKTSGYQFIRSLWWIFILHESKKHIAQVSVNRELCGELVVACFDQNYQPVAPKQDKVMAYSALLVNHRQHDFRDLGLRTLC